MGVNVLYHIQVHLREERRPIVHFDLDEATLQRDFLEPFRQGRDFNVNGWRVPIGEITRIKVTQTEASSDELFGFVDLEEKVGTGPPTRHPGVRAVLAAERGKDVTSAVLAAPPIESERRKVFLVKGRWDEATEAMIVFLQSLNLHVIKWEDAELALGGAGNFAADVVDKGFEMSYATVVMLTPDDLVLIHPALIQPHDPRDLMNRPRANVLFELGYAWHLNRKKTLVVQYGDISLPSDLGSLQTVRFDATSKTRQQVMAKLATMGVAVNGDDGRWQEAGKFPKPLPALCVTGPALLGALPLHWILLAKLSDSDNIDVRTIAAETRVPMKKVQATLNALLQEGLVTLPGNQKPSQLKNGRCQITVEGRRRLDEETRRYQS